MESLGPYSNWDKDVHASYSEDCEHFGYTYIPDDNFEQALIELGYDDELDDYVQTSSISGATSLDVHNRSIADLTGIEDFVSLSELKCHYNQLASIDVSQHTSLISLWCYHNQLTSLDVSQNTAMSGFFCDNNQLTNIDLSQNTALESFSCSDNQLTNLNVHNGNNSSITWFDALYNPSLKCIEVDNEADANAGLPPYNNWQKDATASYSENCSSTSINKSFVTGWNWFSVNVLNENMSLGNLFTCATEGDYIKNQTLSATYYDIGGWFGSLAEMSPTEGYMFKKQSADQILYPECAPGDVLSTPVSRKSTVSDKIIQHASFDPHQFEFNGTVTANIYVGGNHSGGENDLLLTSVDDQLRGVSEGLYFEPTGAYAFPLMVYSNIAEGDIISFKYFDSDSEQFFSCNETLAFSKDMIVDNAFESFKLNVNSALGVILPENLGPSLYVYPNPFRDQLHIEYSVAERTKVRLAVYDILGKTLRLLDESTHNPGRYMTGWNPDEYKEGTYIIKLTTQNSTMRQIVFLVK